MSKPISSARSSGSIEPAVPVPLAALVDYAEGSVVSRTLAKGAGGTLTLFAFAEGEGLSEHSAPFDAYVQVLDGRARLTIGGESLEATAGDLVLLPSGVPHALEAKTRFKMLLVMLRDPG